MSTPLLLGRRADVGRRRTHAVARQTSIIVMGQALRRTVIELEEAARREAVLAQELAHRGRNTLALVGALVRQSQRENRPPAEFYEALMPRLQALARAQDLLTHANWTACSIRWLVNEALGPFAQHAGLRAEGPDFPVAARICLPLVMALHELATNACKYGALAVPEGGVHLTWHEEAHGIRVMHWREHGGPRVSPPTHRGLGSRLLTREPAFADVDLLFPPDGVRCTIRF